MSNPLSPTKLTNYLKTIFFVFLCLCVVNLLILILDENRISIKNVWWSVYTLPKLGDTFLIKFVAPALLFCKYPLNPISLIWQGVVWWYCKFLCQCVCSHVFFFLFCLSLWFKNVSPVWWSVYKEPIACKTAIRFHPINSQKVRNEAKMWYFYNKW